MGDVLSEADWCMKSLQVGVQSNKEKTKFWSWQKKSNLDGLATVLDFPKPDKPPGSVFMSCESARVEKDENEIAFPEEPKMRIVDDSNSLYSKYITDIYPSVAYHDETLFLKMQELIKLILVAEWLIEKGTKISTKWMTKFTTKSDDPSESGVITSQNETKEAPKMLIPPQPIEVGQPTSDVTVKTEEAEQNRSLVRRGQYRLYGWLDHGGKEMVWCDEDGKVVEKNQSMKSVFKHEMTIGGGPPMKLATGWGSLPIPPDAAKLMLTSTDVDHDTSVTKTEPIPRNSHEEFTGPFGASVSVDVTHDDNVNKKDGRETKVTKTLHPPPHLASQVPKITHTTTVKESVDDYDMLYSHLDPNKPIRPNIPGLCEEVSPDVLSWSELFRETVPWPHVMQIMPPNKEGPIVAAQGGGVTAREIPVTVEQRTPTRYNGETRRVNQYIQRGSTIGIQAQRNVIHGEIRPANQQEFAQILDKFQGDWDSKKGACPAVNYVFVVTNPTLEGNWKRYRQQLRIKTCEQYYHGTSLSCNITSLQKLCANTSCGICGISSDGLDTKLIRQNIQFQRFGHGFYLAPNSSKCHDYTEGANGYRAMLLCDVYPGRKYTLEETSQNLTSPPRGYDSIYGVVTANSVLNFPEIVVHNPHAVMPRYIIIYRKDGVAHPLGV